MVPARHSLVAAMSLEWTGTFRVAQRRPCSFQPMCLSTTAGVSLLPTIGDTGDAMGMANPI
jgi:hypothetical protein